jgi:GntR family transcriptional regulator/MocR family aminotransferase
LPGFASVGSGVSEAPLPEWNLNIFLPPRSTAPVYRQIAKALAHEVQRGRLQPGDSLPGYRSLAEQLGVSRNTVMAAFQDLQAQGLIVSRTGSGSEIAAAPPVATAEVSGAASDAVLLQVPARGDMGFDLATGDRPAEPGVPEELPRTAGSGPDPRLLPVEILGRAYRRALASARRNECVLGDPQGHPRLRRALGAMLASSRGIAGGPERIFVTRGSQNAFFLIAQALIEPGEAVAVERLGPRSAWKALARAGARCLPIPVDDEGLDVEALAEVAASTRLRAVLVTPRRQYPTLVTLGPSRRARLLKLASERRFAVLEWDPDFELQFEARPVAPLAADDSQGVVIHVGTLSKLLGPNLRLGFVCGPEPLMRRMKAQRADFDGGGDLVFEQAVGDLMEEGELQSHLARMHPIYRRRRDALCAALSSELGTAVQAPPPAGGLALWVKVAPEIDVNAWASRSMQLGAPFRPGSHFDFRGAAVQGLRIGFASAREEELLDIARRMGRALIPATSGHASPVAMRIEHQ